MRHHFLPCYAPLFAGDYGTVSLVKAQAGTVGFPLLLSSRNFKKTTAKFAGPPWPTTKALAICAEKIRLASAIWNAVFRMRDVAVSCRREGRRGIQAAGSIANSKEVYSKACAGQFASPCCKTLLQDLAANPCCKFT
jgi:hypothetical protein